VLVPTRITRCRVAIHDWKGRDAERPRAVIKSGYSGAPGEPTETVDIIRSIRANPQSIRHFAIQAAIRRWEGLVRYNYRLPVHSGEAKVRIRGGGEYNRGVSSHGFLVGALLSVEASCIMVWLFSSADFTLG
jgi:hypothetical protein